MHRAALPAHGRRQSADGRRGPTALSAKCGPPRLPLRRPGTVRTAVRAAVHERHCRWTPQPGWRATRCPRCPRHGRGRTPTAPPCPSRASLCLAQRGYVQPAAGPRRRAPGRWPRRSRSPRPTPESGPATRSARRGRGGSAKGVQICGQGSGVGMGCVDGGRRGVANATAASSKLSRRSARPSSARSFATTGQAARERGPSIREQSPTPGSANRPAMSARIFRGWAQSPQRR
jgi:hypothetical protein